MKLLLLLLLFASPASAGWFGPSTYEECVDEFVPAAETSYAARAINYTCNSQFTKNRTADKYMNYYDCIREEVAAAKNDSSAKIILRRCVKKSGVNKK